MNDTISARKKMVKSFVVVAPDTRVKVAEDALQETNAEYCVIKTIDGEPLALLTQEQLRDLPDKEASLSDELAALPTAVPVEGEQLLTKIAEDLSLFLLGSSNVRGLVVLYLGDIVGILSRQAITEHTFCSFGLGTISTVQTSGDPVSRPPTYLCPRGDHSEAVSPYDPQNPPTCPNHGILLIRKK